MSEPLEEYRQQASYRRGTVMGLTAAEAFMLIAFILLTLLVLWRVTANEEKQQLIEENKALSETIERLGSEDAIAVAIAFHRRFENQDPGLMEERLALVEDEAIRDLLEDVRALPPDGLLELTDMMREDAFPGVREKVNAIDRSGLQPREIEALAEAGQEAEKLRETLAAERERVADLAGELERAVDAKRTLERAEERLRKQVEAFTAVGATPENIEDMRAALAEIGERKRSFVRTGAEIAATISGSAGERIAALGGRILPDGDVIFPDAVLFDSGKADIRPEFDELLQSFCRLWFETLYEQRDALDTVQVEGHASSEYGSLSPERAFVANLLLSQRRAAAVFGRCLAYGGDDEVTEWARGAMAAIGYSSSRAIVDDGVENKAASRRVVFALEPKSENKMAASVLEARPTDPPNVANERQDRNAVEREERAAAPLASDAGADDGASSIPDGKVPEPDFYRAAGYSELLGPVVRVRDGDTIVVGDQPVRLEGLHAPETDTDLGRRARTFMSDLVFDKAAICFLSGDETYDRKVGVCFVEGRDIAAAVIAAGMGLDCPAFSQGRYSGLGTAAVLGSTSLPEYCRVR